MRTAGEVAVLVAAALLIGILSSTNADTDPSDGQFFSSLPLFFFFFVLDYVCMWLCIYWFTVCVCVCV